LWLPWLLLLRYLHYATLDTPYGAWIVARIRQKLALSRGYSSRTTMSDVAWAEAIIAAAEPALDDAYRPCYVMENYKEANMVVQRTDGAWRVGGVFDLMEAHFGDGEADLVRQACSYLDEDRALAEAFVQAYTEYKPLRPGHAARLALYMLDDRLTIWEYFQRPTHVASWHEEGTLRDWAEQYILFCSSLFMG